MARTVFIFAHQDDEIAAASRIRFVRNRGDGVTCIYLTDGAAAVPSEVRDAETRKVLARLGVDDIHFIGSRERIADGSLPEHLDRALALVDAEVVGVDEVVTLAWEGGHQDHDAAHLVAAVFARQRGVPCVEMPLYNGHGVGGRLFRVHHPIGDGWQSRWISLREKLTIASLCRFYPSQRKTWMGLLPLMLLTLPRELTRAVDLRRAESPPHRGALLYERRFHYPYSRFAPLAQQFLRRSLLD